MKKITDDIEPFKSCEFCNAPLPKNSTDTLCANCFERALFSEVKDYIREMMSTNFK